MRSVILSALILNYSGSASAQCRGYPCDTLWYDESGKLKDEFVINNIVFDLGRENLVRYPYDSTIYGAKILHMYLRLDSLASVLRADKGKFEIQCHSDCRGSNNYSMNLSHRRAQSVLNYLVLKGVEEINLIPRGYEDSLPRKISEAGRDISLECRYIENYKEKDKTLYEFYHQLNRRIVVRRAL